MACSSLVCGASTNRPKVRRTALCSAASATARSRPRCIVWCTNSPADASPTTRPASLDAGAPTDNGRGGRPCGATPRAAIACQRLCVQIGSFSLCAAVREGVHDRKRPRQPCEHIARAARPDGRVQLDTSGQLELELETPWRCRATSAAGRAGAAAEAASDPFSWRADPERQVASTGDRRSNLSSVCALTSPTGGR